jgi:hypothetical protein
MLCQPSNVGRRVRRYVYEMVQANQLVVLRWINVSSGVLIFAALSQGLLRAHRLPVHLDPRAVRMFNISAIIHTQIPDDEGNIIPATFGARDSPSIHHPCRAVLGQQSRKQSCSSITWH